MIDQVDQTREALDTVGGVFEVVVKGLPIGVGSYVHWDRRLDTALAGAMASIQSVKGVEFGLGFEQTRAFGSEVHDVIEGRNADGAWVHRTNRAGGLTGGVTNGEPLVIRGAVKPISTLARPLPSADLITGEKVEKAHYERSDISVVPAAGVIGEAMAALAIVPFLLEKLGGDYDVVNGWKVPSFSRNLGISAGSSCRSAARPSSFTRRRPSLVTKPSRK